MEKKKTLHLPHELIIEILLKLPVKSLIRFKCVCKSWFTLISDPHFANSHFQLTQTPRFLSITSDLETQYLYLEASLDNGTVFASSNPNFLVLDIHFDFHIKGSCRGFILLQSSSSLYIWNPSTGAHIQIPLFTTDSNSEKHNYYGFGYDQSTNDYLVVSVFYDPNAYDSDMVSRLGIFSSRGNSWKEMEGINNQLPYLRPCINLRAELLFNGAIHWLAFRYDIKKHVIVVFHLTESKLLEMSVSDEIDSYNYRAWGLWEFKGFISLWTMDYSKAIIEIWVMEEYNVRSSWTKTLVLSFDYAHCCYPIYYTNCGDIVGTNGLNGLVKYNDKGQMLECCSFCNDPCNTVVMYTESLFVLTSW